MLMICAAVVCFAIHALWRPAAPDYRLLGAGLALFAGSFIVP
jgi:hypothetical protein